MKYYKYLQEGELLLQKKFIHITLLVTLFSFVNFAQNQVELSNNAITRIFQIENNNFRTSKLINTHTKKNFNRGLSTEFLVKINDSLLSSSDFIYSKHHLDSNKVQKHLEVILLGKENTYFENITVKLHYWLYEDLPVVRKMVSIENNKNSEISISDLDIENLNLDVSGYHISELYTAYGENFEKKPYKGNYNDSAILIFDPKGNQGVIVGNEALSVMKRTEIYVNGFPIVQIGLANSDDPYPFKVSLKPGDSFNSPKTFLCMVETPIWQMAYEGAFAEFIRKHLDIELFEHTDTPLLMYNTWRPYRMSISEEIVLESADALENSGTDLFIIDCGWYDMMGDYNVDSSKFPNGLASVCNYINQKGMKTGLWFSFATANVNSSVAKENPDWIIKDKNLNPVLIHDKSGKSLGEDAYTMSMDSPWYDYIKNVISNYVKTCNLSYLKLDLAAAVGSYQADPSISGDYEFGGVKGYQDRESSYWAIFQKTLDFCDDLHAQFPDLLIDYTYETHGRHNAVDYALLQHAEYEWLTNYELQPPLGPLSIRQIRYLRSRTMPVSTLLIGNQNMINASQQMNEYTYMSVASSTGILVGDIRNMNEETRQWYKFWDDWFTQMNEKYQFTKYYQIGDVFDYPTLQNWDGCYRFNTEKEGGVLFFYRNGSFDKVRKFKVHCVNPNSRYKIYDPSKSDDVKFLTGNDLLERGIEVSLPEMYSAKVIGIEKID